MKVSYSRVSSYLSCPQAHYFGYVMGLKHKGIVRPLTFGGDFHKLLEHRHEPKVLSKLKKKFTEEFYSASPQAQGELGENYVDDLITVFKDYRKVWKDSPKPLETEHEFLVKIGVFKGEDVYFHGIIDEVYPDNVIGEHKTFTQAPNMGTLAMNTQICLYSKAWELETGHKISTVIWDYIKSDISKFPVWLEKSGRFSEASLQSITPMSWERACVAKGITDPAIVGRGVQLYQQNIGNFFFKCSMEILPQMVDTVWDDFKAVVKDIAVKGDTNKVKNIDRDCNWCNYRPICYAQFTGSDVDYVIETDYEIKERK